MGELVHRDYLGVANRRIADIGLSVVFEPDSPAVVDIVFLHGLQGHPFKTWASSKVPKSQRSESQRAFSAAFSSAENELPKKSLREKFRRIVRRRVKYASEDRTNGAAAAVTESLVQEEIVGVKTQVNAQDVVDGNSIPCFWLKDLLPSECPKARILTWGYDTHVTKYFTGASNKNNILSHAKDLLFGLRRARDTARPMIFVAHSLGGIVVKEMLSASDVSDDLALRDIVESTAAIIFLGTPHRGSLDMARLGESARKIASAIRMDTSSTTLDALGLKTSDLERCQESFSRLWAKYDFRVKTFQEGLGLTSANIGALNDKIVPSFSSLLGDSREQAETLQANHMGMCRFFGPHDPNFIKVGGEIVEIYTSIVNFKNSQFGQAVALKPTRTLTHDDAEKACLQSLRLPGLDQGRDPIKRPARSTCGWLFDHNTFVDWHDSQNVETHRGLIWIRGNPGSGKSTLMREAHRRISQIHTRRPCYTAAFFFGTKKNKLLSSPEGLYRSLLCQLLPHRPGDLRKVVEIYQEKVASIDRNVADEVSWDEVELRDILQGLFEDRSSPHTILLIDALDECEGDQLRDLAFFFRDLTNSAHEAGAKLQVCLSSRHFGAATVSNCPVIMVEQHNKSDIMCYLDQKLAPNDTGDSGAFHRLKSNIVEMSSGNFLWVVLVVDTLLKDLDEGKNETHLESRLSTVPLALQDLFTDLLKQTHEDREATLRFFQWVILAGELRLREWHHILPFLRRPRPHSLQECRESINFAETDAQLEKQIRHISMGLVEVTTNAGPRPLEVNGSDDCSIAAGAGSLDLETGETRIVRVIHESVRQFFLHEDGFSILKPNLGRSAIGEGYISIMDTCLDFITVPELDVLVNARLKSLTQLDILSEVESSRWGGLDSGGSSIRSFSSASSLRYSRALEYCSSNSTSSADRQDILLPSSVQFEPESTHQGAQSTTDMQPSSTKEMMDYRLSLLSQFRPEDGVPVPVLSNSLSVSSIEAQIGVLQDYPTLLLYILTTFFIHARSAEKEGANATGILLRLREGRLWKRWLCLCEEVPHKYNLIAYAEAEGLSSWVTYLSLTRMNPYIHAAANDRNTGLDSTLIQNTVLNYCHDRGDSFIETLKDRDCPDESSPESHQSNIIFRYKLSTQLRSALVDTEGRSFIPLKLLRQVITLPATTVELQQIGSDPELAKIIWSSFLRVFGMLLMMEAHKYIIEFIKLGIDDTYLPFLMEHDKKYYECRLKSQKEGKAIRIDSWEAYQYDFFVSSQWGFLAPFFALPQGSIYHFKLDSVRVRLPIIEQDKSVRQDQQSVERVKFHPLSCDFGDFRFRKEADDWYILKTLSPKTGWKSFLAEVYGWKLLNGQIKNNLNIVPLLCTFESPVPNTKKSLYHLIFPSPSGDLPKLWATYPAGGGAKIHTQEWVALQCLAITDSLAAIHQNERNKKLHLPGRAKRKRFMRRGGILPCRLWWFRSSAGDNESDTLVLSNFDIECCCTSPSITWGAPEFSIIDEARFKRRRKIGPKVDIWSLACIWLELSTWYFKGKAGMEEFVDSRLELEPESGIYTDTYFRLQDNRQTATVKSQVTEWIKHLQSQEKCTPVLHGLLAYVEEKMLVVDCDKRATALEVLESMKQLCGIVLSLPEQQDDLTS